MANLDIQVTKAGDQPPVCVVTLTGGIEAANYARIEAVFKKVFKAGYKRVVLALGAVRFMNEPDRLLKYEAAFRKVGGGMVLYDVPAKLRVVFGTLELDKKIAVRGSLADAKAALCDPEPVDRRMNQSGEVPVERRLSASQEARALG